MSGLVAWLATWKAYDLVHTAAAAVVALALYTKLQEPASVTAVLASEFANVSHSPFPDRQAR